PLSAEDAGAARPSSSTPGSNGIWPSKFPSQASRVPRKSRASGLAKADGSWRIVFGQRGS
ncbi:hypothetical protein ACLBXB_29270, partial [Methylobacterium mesophilicum]